MDSQETTQRVERRESSDIGASIFAGAIFCLAIYGGYKLFQKEVNQLPPPSDPVDTKILDRIVEQEMQS